MNRFSQVHNLNDRHAFWVGVFSISLLQHQNVLLADSMRRALPFVKTLTVWRNSAFITS